MEAQRGLTSLAYLAALTMVRQAGSSRSVNSGSLEQVSGANTRDPTHDKVMREKT